MLYHNYKSSICWQIYVRFGQYFHINMQHLILKLVLKSIKCDFIPLYSKYVCVSLCVFGCVLRIDLSFS